MRRRFRSHPAQNAKDARGPAQLSAGMIASRQPREKQPDLTESVCVFSLFVENDGVGIPRMRGCVQKPPVLDWFWYGCRLQRHLTGLTSSGRGKPVLQRVAQKSGVVSNFHNDGCPLCLARNAAVNSYPNKNNGNAHEKNNGTEKT